MLLLIFFATFNWFLLILSGNLLELIVSVMWLTFSEAVLICKLLQEKFVSSRYVVTLFNKFIKLSMIFCMLSNSFLKKQISSFENYPSNRLTCSNEHSQFSFGGNEGVECHDDVKAVCFSQCFQYSIMEHFAAMIPITWVFILFITAAINSFLSNKRWSRFSLASFGNITVNF